MKTIQQRLQSRISLRRNFIAELEDDVSFFRESGLLFVAKNVRKRIAPLAIDQKLDKELFNYLTGMQQIFGEFTR